MMNYELRIMKNIGKAAKKTQVLPCALQNNAVKTLSPIVFCL